MARLVEQAKAKGGSSGRFGGFRNGNGQTCIPLFLSDEGMGVAWAEAPSKPSTAPRCVLGLGWIQIRLSAPGLLLCTAKNMK